MQTSSIKRLGAALLVCLVLITGFALPLREARAETAIATGYVNSTTLNMRPDASTHQPVVATLKRGMAVNVYEICGVWLRIDVPELGKAGYVSGRYITLNAAGFSGYGLGSTTGTVHVRSKATAESASNGTVQSKTGLILEAVEPNGWWKVKVQATGLAGYISKRYVHVICKTGKAPASASQSTSATISGNGVNFRSGPSTKDKSLGQLAKGTAVSVLSATGSWYQIKVTSTGKTGYVYKTFVTLAATTTVPAVATATPAITGTSGYISGSSVNLRSGPSTRDKSLGKLALNTPIQILSTTGKWTQIKVSATGAIGYVYSTYVKLSASTAATPTPTPANNAATPSPVPTATPAVLTGSGYINKANVNFRSGPSTSNASLGKLALNAPVKVLSVNGNWSQITVTATGQTGYVFRTFVTLTASGSTQAPAATATPVPTATPVATATPFTPPTGDVGGR